MRRAALLVLFLTAPLAADQHRSNISLGLEAGQAWGSLAGYDPGRLVGGHVRYDITPSWAAAARFQSRVFERKDDQSQRTLVRPITAAGFYNFLKPGRWTPYGFAELGVSNSRRTVQAVPHTSEKPCLGLGLGMEFDFLPLHTMALELAYRHFDGASPGGHGVSETAVAFSLNFHIPDDWIPIHPEAPLKIPDMDDKAAKPAAPPPVDEKHQAQEELDKVQRDIRERKVPPIHFETGQAVLLKASFETLDIVGTILRRYPQLSVLITGHTDEVGSTEDNQILSLARGEVVRAYLIQNFGLPAEKLSAQGAGAAKPIADNNTEEGRFLNRRVEFTIQP